jgi:hypothetical protein
VAAATVVYAILTRSLVSETKRLREVQTEPRLEVTPQSLDIAINLLWLRVRNAGLGPAFKVQLKPRVIDGGAVADALLSEFTSSGFFNAGLAYLGPGDERVSRYTDMRKDGSAKCQAVLAFDLSYEGPTGRTYSATVIINMAEQLNDYQLGTPHLYSIAKSLDSIKDDVNHIATGFRRVGVNVFSAKDRQEERGRRGA